MWLESIKKDWFQEYFGAKDDTWHDRRYKDIRSPCGPRGSNRRRSPQQAGLIVAHPSLDLHLSYSEGLERGPIIERSGDASPFMEDPEQPGRYTADPDEQRIGTYYLTEEKKRSDIRRLFYCFAGSYLLQGALFTKFITAEEVQREAADVLRDYFEHWQEFPLPDPIFTPFTLDKIINQFFYSFKEFFSISSHTSDYRNKIEDSFPHEINIERDSILALFDLYCPSFPEFREGFMNLINNTTFRDAVSYNMKKFLRLTLKALKTPAHETVAKETARENGQTWCFMQGCGDLTMNEWNVAFVRGLSNKSALGWDLLHPPREPLHDRVYTCLLKWSCEVNEAPLVEIAKTHRVVHPYQIADVRFHAPSLEVGRPDGHVFLVASDPEQRDEPIGHLLEFAVYGQQLYRAGNPTALRSLVREFGDLRHIYKLSNLNRKQDYGQELRNAEISEYDTIPRNLFNHIVRNEIWLGEAELIQGDRNLKVAALNQSLQLDLKHLGAPEEWIEVVLNHEEKEEIYCKVNREVLHHGEWRWVTEGQTKLLEIFFQRNQYPCSMIGIKAEDEEKRSFRHHRDVVIRTKFIYFLAHGHQYNWEGCTIEEAAQFLNEEGASDILMFDEGNDVFQIYRTTSNPSTSLVETVPFKRDQLRCVFWGMST